MTLLCTPLRSETMTDATRPVISPYWRLKRSGDWTVLWKYDPEQTYYSVLSPLVAATLPLFSGKLSFRHLSMLTQYVHGWDSLDEARKFLLSVIKEANKDNEVVVQMEERLTPYVRDYDPLAFVPVDVGRSRQRRLAFPLSLNVMFSNACQTRCVYCYAQRRNVPPTRLLRAERWIDIFREAHALGVEQVSLSGGDPLFRKESLNFIAELVRLEMLFLLSTKCHVTREMAERLVEIGMNKPVNQYTRELQISMDGPDEATADVLAGSPGYFRRSLDSIRNLAGRGFNFRVKAVLTPLNASRVREWVELLVGLGVTRISVAAYNRTFYRHDDRLFLSQEDRALIGAQLRQAQSDFPDVEFVITGFHPSLYRDERPAARPQQPETSVASADGKAAAWKTRTHCSGGRSSMTITPDGKVILCDTVPQEGAFVVGDVSTESIHDVWNSEALLAFAYPDRDKFAGTPCYDCSDFADCQQGAGYCFRDAFFNFGTVYGPPPKCPRAPGDGMRME